MTELTITRFAQKFGLSRSTLLYYDRIGLLRAKAHSRTGYRLYGPVECQRMERIVLFRKAGLSLKEIVKLLDEGTQNDLTAALENQLSQLDDEMEQLKSRQALIMRLLGMETVNASAKMVNVDQWVALLSEVGLDESSRKKWHQAFERDAPDAHDGFLRSLGMPEAEVKRVRAWSQKIESTPGSPD